MHDTDCDCERCLDSISDTSYPPEDIDLVLQAGSIEYIPEPAHKTFCENCDKPLEGSQLTYCSKECRIQAQRNKIWKPSGRIAKTTRDEQYLDLMTYEQYAERNTPPFTEPIT